MGWFRNDTEAKRTLDMAVRASARAATRLIVDADSTAPTGSASTGTRVGGTPYAERGERWPTWGPKGIPYDFAFQLDLRGCEGRPRVPAELLAVFLCWAAVEAVDIEGACIVRAYEQVDAGRSMRMERPAPVSTSDFRVKPCRVSTEATLSYPWGTDRESSIRQAAATFRDPARAYHDALHRLGAEDQHYSHIGGYPAWVQDDGLDSDDYVFVAQVVYEPQTALLIQDAAPIYILWSRDERRYVTDCFQSF